MEKESFTTTLKNARLAKGLSVTEMARRTKVCRDTYARFEKGGIKKLSFLHLVAKELGYRIESELVKIES